MNQRNQFNCPKSLRREGDEYYQFLFLFFVNLHNMYICMRLRILYFIPFPVCYRKKNYFIQNPIFFPFNTYILSIFFGFYSVLERANLKAGRWEEYIGVFPIFTCICWFYRPAPLTPNPQDKIKCHQYNLISAPPHMF